MLINITQEDREWAQELTDEKRFLDRQQLIIDREAREERRQKARQEGFMKGREKVARNALAEGATLEFVQKISGIEMAVLEKIQKELMGPAKQSTTSP